MKRVITSLFILTVVIGASLAGYQYLSPPVEAVATLAQAPFGETVEVSRETLLSTVEATGPIEASSEVELKFETGGIVAEVLVKRGQFVAAGAPLARLRTDELQLAIENAKITLAQSQAELQQLYEPKLTEKIEAAQASVSSAQAKLAEKLAGPDQDEITKAASDLRKAEIKLKQKQWAYDQVSYRGDVGASGEAAELQEATLEYEAALAEYNIKTKGPTKTEIAEARSALAEAKASLAELLKQPSVAEIAIKQATVDKAKIELQQKQQDLEQAILIAPTNGVVLEVNIEPGERTLDQAENAALVLADTSAYLLKVQIDEIDIARIRRDQQVSVTLDALVDQILSGQVADIAPRPTKQQNNDNAIVTYEVTIAMETPKDGITLLSGMTANAAIETARLENALVVPNQAIQVDRESAEPVTFVEKLDSQGKLMRVEVALGQRTDTQTQILAGVEEGDKIIVRNLVGLPGEVIFTEG